MAIKDTHKTVKNLIESGFTEKQAEAITLVVTESSERKIPTTDVILLILIFCMLVFSILNQLFPKRL